MMRAIRTMLPKYAAILLLPLLLLGACAETMDSGIIAPGKLRGAAAAPPRQEWQAYTALPAAPAPQPPILPEEVKVGLLLPLSGAQAALGQAMLNAAQMAVFDGGGQNFTLLPRDTGEDAAGAVNAMHAAVAAGSRLMIGPVFAGQVAAAKQAAPAGINLLALSSDASLAAPGVYVIGFSPASQVRRAVDFAATHGALRVAAAIPEGAYGDVVAAALIETMQRRGGVVVTARRYAPGGEKRALQDIAAEREQIDALLIAEGGAGLRRIAALLPEAQLTARVRLLGTGLWDEDNLAQAASALQGGWYAAPAPEKRRAFVDNYRAAYGKEPPRLATLAYDATALAMALARRGGAVDAAALTNANGFAGVDGIFRLGPNGVAERGLAILQLGPHGAEVIDPAPVSFGSVKSNPANSAATH